MTNFFIIHGAYGDPDENWFPWLKSELEEKGYAVFVPEFPTPENQTLENWLEVFEEYKDKVDQESVFIAHSLGPAFVLNFLERNDKKIKACFFVAACADRLGIEKFDEINKSFVNHDFDWQKIKELCEKFIMFHSLNDPYIPVREAEKMALKLNADLTVLKNAEHFNEDAGYFDFPMLLEKMERELNLGDKMRAQE